MTATHTQSVAKEARTRQVDLSDLVREYADELPKTGWLTRLNLVRPRENQQCLPNVTRITKRVVDVIVASLLLVLMSPVLLVCVLLVKLTSPGPAIYLQTRVGLNLRKKAGRDRRQRRDLPDGAEERRSTGESCPTTAGRSRCTSFAQCELMQNSQGAVCSEKRPSCDRHWSISSTNSD